MDKAFKVQDGVVVANGNIGFGTDTANVTIDAGLRNDAVLFPNGTTGQRPTGSNGMLRFNTTTGEFEGFSTPIGGWSTLTLAGSSVDADFLDSQPASYYLSYTNFTGTITAGHFNANSHGALAEGTLHATANSTANGFMSNAHWNFLDYQMPLGPAWRQQNNLTTEDLDNVNDSGYYRQPTDANATALRHYPENLLGVLEVFQHVNGGGDVSYIQRYHVIASGYLWVREKNGATPWTAWRRIYDSVNLTQSIVNSVLANSSTTIVGTGTLASGSIANTFGNVNIGTSTFTGNGAGISYANASVLLTGTLPDGRFPSTLPAASGANLTAIPTTALTGTLPDGRIPNWVFPTATVVDGSTDWNTLTTAGWQPNLYGTTNANRPVAGVYFYVHFLRYAANGTQIAYPYLTGTTAIYVRNLFGGVWTSWRKIAYDDEVASLTGAAFTGPVSVAANVTFTGTTLTASANASITGLLQSTKNISTSANLYSNNIEVFQNADVGGYLTADTGIISNKGAFSSANSAVYLSTASNGFIRLSPANSTSTLGRVTANTTGMYVEGVFGANGDISATTGTFSAGITAASLIAVGNVVTEANFVGQNATAIVANRSGAGTIYLRPNTGVSTTGQLTVASSGAATISGTLAVGNTTISGTVASGNTSITGTLAASGVISENGFEVAKVYKGSTVGQTSFPIGHYVLCPFGNIPNRNATIGVYLTSSDSTSYSTTGSYETTILAGTWSGRGYAGGTGRLVQRIA